MCQARGLVRTEANFHSQIILDISLQDVTGLQSVNVGAFFYKNMSCGRVIVSLASYSCVVMHFVPLEGGEREAIVPRGGGVTPI